MICQPATDVWRRCLGPIVRLLIEQLMRVRWRGRHRQLLLALLTIATEVLTIARDLALALVA